MMNGNQLTKRLAEILSAWERFAPGETLGGMTPAELRAAVQPSLDERARKAALAQEIRACVARRKAADEKTRPLLRLVSYAVKGHPRFGENSDLIRAMGYQTLEERATGLTRKVQEEPTENTEPL